MAAEVERVQKGAVKVAIAPPAAKASPDELNKK